MHARPTVAAKTLLTDRSGRVLLVKPTYKTRWDLPGGYVEADETPTTACVRELTEELGIRIPPPRLVLADWAPAPREGDRMCLVFDGGHLTDAETAGIGIDGAELTDFRFAHPDTFADLLSPRLADRVRVALDARTGSRTVYRDTPPPVAWTTPT